jgi:hypothetical protein
VSQVVPATNALVARTTVAVLAMVGGLVLATLWLCQGHFVYSLDDPYISLGLGWHIWHGHYGLNATEFSSPSSSIVYPFLLAAFAWSDLQQWAPLLINTAAAVATAALFAAMVGRHGSGARSAPSWRAALLLITLCVAMNIVGLVFTGLEHSLHALVSAAIIFGLARTFERGTAPGWLLVSIICAPLLRFEGLAESVLALLALALVGRPGLALWGAAAIAVLVGLYMMGMAALGLPLLPSSVLVKSVVFAPGHSYLGHAQQILQHAWSGAGHAKLAYVIWFVMAAAVLHPVLRSAGTLAAAGAPRLTVRHEGLLIGVALGTLAAQTLLGLWVAQHRYEIYALTATVATFIVVWHREIDAWMSRSGSGRIVLAAVLLLGATEPYVRGTFMSPWAGRGIYEQQFQMHRFVQDYYRRPVAVNDLGWVSYRNPNYVLDLLGLASESVRETRMRDPLPGWPEKFTRAHGVGLAMIYTPWFAQDLPGSWQPVAQLQVAHQPVTAPFGTVTFYATSAAAAPAARAALHEFAATLPATVARISWEPAIPSGK